MGKILSKYHIIGDVHGYASFLKKLLKKLGYKKNKSNKYYHPKGFKVIFVGDYIDRGKEEESTIEIVKEVVESDCGIALMGNHEYNAICYATPTAQGYLRQHTEKNTYQHQAFLDEYPFGSKKYKEAIEWFKTLPIYFEDKGIRVIHAAWSTKDIEKVQPFLNKNNTIKDSLLLEIEKEGEIYNSMETLLKGVEYELPNGMVWKDKDGIERNTMRFNWFKPVEKVTYKNCALSIPEYVDLPDIEIVGGVEPYNEKEVVFFGHYWMIGEPKPQTEKTACVDYSVAKKGILVAYEWSGESILKKENFISP